MRAFILLPSVAYYGYVGAISSSTKPLDGSMTSLHSVVAELSFAGAPIFPREAWEEEQELNFAYPLADRDDISPSERLFRVAATIHRTGQDPDDWAGKWAIKHKYADEDKESIFKRFLDYAFEKRYGGEKGPLYEINDINLFDAEYRRIHRLPAREYEPLTTVANPRTIDPDFIKRKSQMWASKTQAKRM